MTLKRIAVAVANIVGQLTSIFYKYKNKTSLLGELFYGQMIKYSFRAPYSHLLFVVRPVCIIGGRYICVGDTVKIGKGSTVSAWVFDKKNTETKIIIGNNVVIGSYDHITAYNSIIIEDNVLLGKYVTITDNSHGKNSVEELSIPPIKRDLYSKGGVIIKKNVWIGDKVTILPNVTIGEGAIVGANSVVTKDVPAFSVVCGNPARVIKTII